MDSNETQKVLEALNTRLEHDKTMADLILEQNHLTRIVTEELRSDRQADHHTLETAVHALEQATKRLVTHLALMTTYIAQGDKKLDNALRNTYDTYTMVSALRSQLEGPLSQAAASAAESVVHVKAVHKSIDDMTGEFNTLKADGKAKNAAIWANVKELMGVFNKFEALTRVLITILFVAMVAAGWLYHVANAK